MADVQTVTKVFDAGFQQDKARDELPAKVLWRCVDFLPSLDNALRMRRGWTQGSGDLSAASSCDYAEIGGYAPFAGDGHALVFGNNGKAYAVRAWNSTAVSLVDTHTWDPPTCPPFWHRDRLIVCPALLGSIIDVRQYYPGGTGYVLSSLAPPVGASFAPWATFGMSWGEYLVLINGYLYGTRYPRRIWYSNPGELVFDPQHSFIDMPEELVACAVIGSAQFFWGYNYTHIITGEAPPPDSTFTVRKNVYAQGIFGPTALVRWKDKAIFANVQGIWSADTATIDDLTVKGGIHSFWRSKVAGLSWQAGARISLGIYNEQLIVSVLDENGVERTMLGYDLNQNYWYEMRNFNARSFLYYPQGQGTTALLTSSEELLFAWGNGPYFGKFSDIYGPGSSGSGLDFDGSLVLPYLETAYFKLGYPWQKRLRRAYITHVASADTQIDNLLAVFATTTLDGSYEVLQYLPRQQNYGRSQPIFINRRGLGIAFRIEAQALINDLKLYEFEMESHPLEGSN